LIQVVGFVVRLAVFTSAGEDADPLEGRRPDGGVVAVSAAAASVAIVSSKTPGPGKMTGLLCRLSPYETEP
jgi:hypothetical protein